MPKKAALIDKAQLRDEWIACVKALHSDIRKWAKTKRWPVDEEEKEVAEELTGPYPIPLLKVKTTGGILYVDPVARDVLGADGRVDIYSWPSLQRLLLIRQHGQWTLQTDSGVEWPEAWDRETFIRLAQQLTRNP